MKQRKNYLSKIAASVCALTLIGALTVPVMAAENDYTDVSESDWFYEDVVYALDKGIMSGTDDNLFSPDLSTSRGMIVTILWRLEGMPEAKSENVFTDVAEGSYYEDAITWASENGIVSGYSENTFAPDDDITREQLASILYRYASFKGADLAASTDISRYSDASEVSEYAVAAVEWAVAKELINGTGESELSPKGTAQRCQTAAILHRFNESVNNSQKPAEENQGNKPQGGMPQGGGQGGPGGMMPQGGMTKESDEKVLATIEEGAVKFTQYTFTDPDTGTALEYSLYTPEKYDSEREYPLVVYVPDSTGAGRAAKDIVENYYGCNSFVTDEEQEKNPCFVLVPAFSETVTTDDWETSDQIETLVKLIGSLGETYSLDQDRYYMTGQSMGCMTSLYLSSTQPDLFAAYLFVSGQWDINVLKGLENQKFFYIAAGGDDKASAGQAEVMAMFDADGVPYTFDEWDAQNDADTQNTALKALCDQGLNGNFVLFTTGTVLNGGSGMEHMASFNYAYKISAVHDWLFEQVKE